MSTSWEPGLGDHLRTIWRYKWFLLGGAVVIAEITFVLLSMVDPRYEADSSLRLTIRSEVGLSLDEDRAEYASRIYAELGESPRLLRSAIDNSGLDLTEQEAAGLVAVDWARPPGFIDLTASGPSPEAAVALADGMAMALVAAVEEDVEAVTDDAAGASVGPAAGGVGVLLSAEVVEAASAPTTPAAPSPLRDAVAAFIISLVLLAEASALWRPARGLLPLTRTAERVTDLVGVPCLTLTGEPEDRTRLALFAARYLSNKPSALVVHCKGEPLPAASVRLAEAVAAGGRRALVIDGEGSEPNLHRRLGLPQGPGLAEVYAGEERLAEAVFVSPSRANLSLLTAGGRDGSRSPLPGDRLLDRLGTAGDYEFIIVNLGAESMPDGIAGALAEMRQSTILVLDPEKTKRRELSDVVHGFGGHDDVIAILLLTKAAASAETKRLAARWWNREGADEKKGGSMATPLRHLRVNE